MFCVLVGLVPPDETLAGDIRQHVVTTTTTATLDEEDNDENLHAITWRSSCSLATDDDSGGALTLLWTAISQEPVTPDGIVEEVERYIHNNNLSVTVEMWASAPAPIPLRPLEGYEKHIVLAGNDGANLESSSDCCFNLNNYSEHSTAMQSMQAVDQAVAAMQEWGIVVQPKVLDGDGVVKFRTVVDTAIAQVEHALAQHRPELVVGHDVFCFQEIASRNKQRFDLRLWSAGGLVRSLLDKNASMRAFLQKAMGISTTTSANEILVASTSTLLEEIDFDVSVVYSRPGAGMQGWHADGAHIKGAPDAGWAEDGWNSNINHPENNQHQSMAKPYAICLFIPLINLNDDMGGTQFWPGSHRNRDLVGFGKVAEVTQSVWNSNQCRAGDGVWYDYRLLHQGMPNTSHDTLRPVIQIIFKKQWYVERQNYGLESIVKDGGAKQMEAREQ